CYPPPRSTLFPYTTLFRSILVILRATFGWREGNGHGGWQFKRRDWITHSQFVKRTGRSSASVSAAIQSLSAAGYIRVEDIAGRRSEEHTSELQSPCNLVCR